MKYVEELIAGGRSICPGPYSPSALGEVCTPEGLEEAKKVISELLRRDRLRRHDRAGLKKRGRKLQEVL
jgi:hypothetical protein